MVVVRYGTGYRYVTCDCECEQSVQMETEIQRLLIETVGLLDRHDFILNEQLIDDDMWFAFNYSLQVAKGSQQ